MYTYDSCVYRAMNFTSKHTPRAAVQIKKQNIINTPRNLSRLLSVPSSPSPTVNAL